MSVNNNLEQYAHLNVDLFNIRVNYDKFMSITFLICAHRFLYLNTYFQATLSVKIPLYPVLPLGITIDSCSNSFELVCNKSCPLNKACN